MESPREWDALFEEAALAYKETAVTRLVTVDSGRVWNYIKRHRERFGPIVEFVEANEFNIISVKKRINDAIERQHLKGIWFPVSGSSCERTGGMLYISRDGAKAGIMQVSR